MASTHSEPAKIEQIITEFFSKSLHIILESRCPCASSRNYSSGSSSLSLSSSSSSFRPRDKWFNLALRDCSTSVLENIDFWRQSNLEPLVIDVVLVQQSWNSESDELGGKSEKIIERWVIHYESLNKGRDSGLGIKRFSSSSSQTLYKKVVLLLRSLYLTVRLLPAYKVFRCLSSSGQIPSFGLTHRVSTFVEPFTSREEVDMQRFVFTPVETCSGRLCVSVLYRGLVSDVSSDTSAPMSPQFIPDYVGSPMTSPLKRLPSLPMPPSSPSASPFGRRHSWSYDRNSAFPSPSPTYSEPRASLLKLGPTRPPPTTLPGHLSETSRVPYYNASFDEYWPSPSFSPSSSPSPPTHVPRSHLSKALLRTDSAPLRKATRPYAPKLERSFTTHQTDQRIDKMLSLGKDEIERLSGVETTSISSPPKSFSRSSSRVSFEDTYDDSEFSGPFVVDDDDMTDPASRACSLDPSGHPSKPYEPGGSFPVRKSQDAAVGALVRMLKKAPPLCQDTMSESKTLVQTSRPESLSSQVLDAVQVPGVFMTSSGLLGTRTTADALEELRRYKEMKDMLLKHDKKF